MNTYAVQVYFDADSQQRINAIWQAIHDADLSSEMLEGAYLPHFTLMIGEIPDLETMQAHLAEYAQNNKQFNINLSYLGVFPTNPSTVFLGLTMTPELIAYHQAFHQQFDASFATQWDHYQPGNWVAHCTIGFKLAPQVVPEITSICQNYTASILNRPITAEKIGIVRVPSAIECGTFDLQE